MTRTQASSYQPQRGVGDQNEARLNGGRGRAQGARQHRQEAGVVPLLVSSPYFAAPTGTRPRSRPTSRTQTIGTVQREPGSSACEAGKQEGSFDEVNASAFAARMAPLEGQTAAHICGGMAGCGDWRPSVCVYVCVGGVAHPLPAGGDEPDDEHLPGPAEHHVDRRLRDQPDHAGPS